MAPNGRPRRVADVFTRALPSPLVSLDEIADLRNLALAHYGARLPDNLEHAIAERRGQIARGTTS